MNEYVFSVSVPYYYTISADNEKDARAILEEEGGVEIMGEIGEVAHKDYLNANLELIIEDEE